MINCEIITKEIKEKIKENIQNNKKNVQLAIIQVGNNPASNKYVSGKLKDAEEVGIGAHLYKFDDTVESYKLIEFINELNERSSINGIVVQLPLPKSLDERTILNTIDINKDVDGFREHSPFIPCTPLGVLTLLDKLKVDLVNKNVVLVGYGKLVNRPLMNLLSNKGANVTVLRSRTSWENLRMYCRQSDVIISAVGENGIINPTCINMLTPPIIIDCGIDIINGKQYGDCNISLYDEVNTITPRVKGMGLFTRVSLMQNTLLAYDKQNNK